jgi:hypothetical protein
LLITFIKNTAFENKNQAKTLERNLLEQLMMEKYLCDGLETSTG